MALEESRHYNQLLSNGRTIKDYHRAPGDGDTTELGYTWTDKPHRLVYDLLGEINHLLDRIDDLEEITLTQTEVL
jgi:hypothetical protein